MLRASFACLLVLTTACSSTPNHGDLVERLFVDVWSEGDAEALAQIHADDFTWRENANANQGREAYTAFMQTYRGAFSDLAFEVTDVVTSTDKIAVSWISRGTHDGPLGELPATGKSVEIEGMTILRVQGGVIVGETTTWDEAGMFEQLGVAR